MLYHLLAAITCGANDYVASNVCTPCAAGSTNDAGDDASGVDTTCEHTLCTVNQHVADNTCEDCQAGTTHPGDHDATGLDTTCTETACEADEYVSSNTCVTCPPGTTNAANDNASGADTACEGRPGAWVGWGGGGGGGMRTPYSQLSGCSQNWYCLLQGLAAQRPLL